MNAKQLIAAAAILAAAGSAFAQQTEFVAADAGFVSTKTRAEVRAELNQAYADGTLATRDGQDAVIVADPHLTRAQVRAQIQPPRQDKLVSSLYFGD